jgi:alpha-tubulin suppressor-like RCC1 family protein
MLPWLLASALAAPPVGPDVDVTFTQVVLGESHACGLWPDGIVACWGENARGQLGNGRSEPSERPFPVMGLTEVTALAAGPLHTCALKKDASVWCWGDDQGRQSGGDGTLVAQPTRIQGLPPVRSVALGATHACALGFDGAVSCWGNNLFGQLGVTDLRLSPVPLPVPGLGEVLALAAGYSHTCVAPTTGGAVCWGAATEGQFGRLQPADSNPLPPTPVDLDLPVLRGLAARGGKTCAIHPEGVTCWGAEGPHEAPTAGDVVRQQGLVQISLGWGHGCALAGAGTVTCWGDRTSGQLGARRDAPVVFAAYGLHDAISVAAGRGETCAARRDGRSVCWGRFSAEEHAASLQELPTADPGRTRERQLPLGVDLGVRLSEVLGPNGGMARLTIATVDNQPCANTRFQVEVEEKRKKVTLRLGDPMLPGGDCIATPAPAVATHDFPAETSGRRDVVIRYKGREDFYQLFVAPDRLEVLPLQDSFSAWDGPTMLWRVPPGSFAISCVDRTDAPLCERRARDGLPTCRELLDRPELIDVPTLKPRDYANTWFTSDPGALMISPDFGHEDYRKLFQQTFADGSGCMELNVRTWTGELWTNQGP